jgi:uncharacterized protein YneF (UPF0154 family)
MKTLIDFLSKIVPRKVVIIVDTIVVVYVTLIINNRKQFKDVPPVVKEKVRNMLIDMGLEELTAE